MKVGNRISVQESLATVKFVGYLPVWGSETLVYGVEWDDVSRGKNSGDLDGISYFHTSVSGAGLFLKATNKKIECGTSLEHAIYERYAGEDNERALELLVKFGTKSVESYGFQKLNLILKNVQELQTLMLDKQKVWQAGNLTTFSNTESLDLSFNLLSEWDELQKIVNHFPNINSLNINGNRFTGQHTVRFPSLLLELLLASTMISVQQLNRLEFTNVEKLILAGNCWTNADGEELILPPSCVTLDLSHNNFSGVPQCIRLSRVLSLNLSDNQIELFPEGVSFPTIKAVDLRYNNFQNWESIDKIRAVFPNLSDLRVDGCPIFEDLTTEEIIIQLIARVGSYENGLLKSKMEMLNGSTITPDEVRNAELYFLSKVNLGEIQFANQKRWKELSAKYGLSPVEKSVRYEESHKISLLVCLEDKETELFSRVFLKSNSILRVKGIVSKKLGTLLLDVNLFYYIDLQETDSSKQWLDDDIATLQSLVLTENQKIYVSLKGAY